MTVKGWCLAVVLLAGCFGGPSEDAPSASPTTTSPRPTPSPTGGPAPSGEVTLLEAFSLAPCDGVSIEMWVEPEVAQAALPEGYTARPFDITTPAGGVPTQRAQATVELYRCAKFDNPVRAYDDVWFGLASITIEPPADGIPDVAWQRYIVETLTAGDILAQLWPAAGLPAYNGTASLGDLLPGTRMAALGAYDLQVIAPATVDQGSYPFVLYHETANGRVTWTGNESSPALALGSGSAAVPVGPMTPLVQSAAPTMLGRILTGERFEDMRMVLRVNP